MNWDEMVVLPDGWTWPFLVTVILGAVSVYAFTRGVYLAYLHPLAGFPGPRVAAVSNIWYAYQWLSGRYPWVIEDVLRKYGDVVRIAPNELVFFTPKAFMDIYAPHNKNLETFVKTNFNDRGKDLGGIIWEEDPVRHREVARKLSPAFSSRSIRGMEPIMHEYMDYFINKMKELGAVSQGVGLVDWTHWLSMDLAADMSWNTKLHQMRDMKHSVYLEAILGFNAFSTVIQVFKRFPLLRPFSYLAAPIGKLTALSKMESTTKKGVWERINQREKIEHHDLFEHILPADSPAPTNRQEEMHIGSLALQVMLANFGPTADWYYATMLLLLEEPRHYKILSEEIRGAFQDYKDIVPTSLAPLPYLHACLEESLRMLPSNCTGLPRISPGAVVDGVYVPKASHVQSSIWALCHSSRYYHDPLRYCPQRWLPHDHPLYEDVFAKDHLKDVFAFSLGPRICRGREMAWVQAKMFMAKVLWTFDVVKVPGQPAYADLEKTLLHYGFFAKPELMVRFVPMK